MDNKLTQAFLNCYVIEKVSEDCGKTKDDLYFLSWNEASKCVVDNINLNSK